MASALCDVPFYFCPFFSFCFGVVLSIELLVLLSLVGLLAADFLVVDLHWSVELLVEFLRWNLWLGVHLGDLKQMVQGLVKVLDWEVVVEMVNGRV